MAGEHEVQSGEAGHQGHDRQPGKDPGNSGSRTPPPGAANAKQVKGRSERSGGNRKEETPDMLHPGPERLDAEKTQRKEPRVEKL